MPSLAALIDKTQRLADKGNADSQYKLGIMYGEEESIFQDYQKVLEWIQKAANQSLPHAQHDLGVMYVEG